MSAPNQKLQRLLAQQRAIAAQIKTIEDREREREEKAIALMIRRHKLHLLDPEKLDRALAVAVAELDAGDQQQPPSRISEVSHGE